jgi:hypothetical protein
MWKSENLCSRRSNLQRHLELSKCIEQIVLDNATVLVESLIAARLESNWGLQTDHPRHRETLNWIGKERKSSISEKMSSHGCPKHRCQKVYSCSTGFWRAIPDACRFPKAGTV